MARGREEDAPRAHARSHGNQVGNRHPPFFQPVDLGAGCCSLTPRAIEPDRNAHGAGALRKNEREFIGDSSGFHTGRLRLRREQCSDRSAPASTRNMGHRGDRGLSVGQTGADHRRRLRCAAPQAGTGHLRNGGIHAADPIQSGQRSGLAKRSRARRNHVRAMTLRQRLNLRYLAIVGVCLLLLTGLAYHELVVEPRVRKELGLPKPSGFTWGESAELFFHAMIPVVLAGGWWLMRRTLAPIDALTRSVERIHAGNLREPLPRTGNGDEVDRLTEVFNAMTARLDDSFQEIRRFTLNASHELKTPLTAMRLHLETSLQGAPAVPREQREWILAQLDEMQRLTQIVDALTLLTKADAGLVRLERQPLQLDELVRESYEDGRLCAESRQVHMALTACEEATVLGDPHWLRQALHRLTDNAVKYNRPAGNVRMTLRKAPNAAELEIMNTGDGIAPELQPHMFERFVRGRDALSSAVEGCGLGLAICQWIVREHGGTIQISSTPGQTTTVAVRLPLATACAPRSPPFSTPR